jgi:DMSO reductase anchor subunit
MDIQNFLAIAVVGVFLSLIIELVTKKISNPSLTKLITLVLAIVVAVVFVWVKNTPYFQTVIVVLGTASTVYGFFLNKKI